MVKFGRHIRGVSQYSRYFVVDYDALKKLVENNRDPDAFAAEWRRQLAHAEETQEAACKKLWKLVWESICSEPESCGMTQEEALRLFVQLARERRTGFPRESQWMPRLSEMNQEGDVRESIESQATSRVSALSISDGERVSKFGSSWAERASVFASAGAEGLQGGSLDHTLLNLLKGALSASETNCEALRKAVKKHDKAACAQRGRGLSAYASGESDTLSAALLPELYASNFVQRCEAIKRLIEVVRSFLFEMPAPGASLQCTGPAASSVPAALHATGDAQLSIPPSADETRPRRTMFAEEVQSAPPAATAAAKPDTLAANAVTTRADIIRANQQAKRAERAWLKETVTKMPPNLLGRLVFHRGFHNSDDGTDRPIENSLDAYESAWTAGVAYCECDVALTLDEHIVLAHDASLERLALDSQAANSSVSIGDLTFRDLMSLPLLDGSRPPLLTEVLDSARRTGDHAKLVIEIKPKNEEAAGGLCRLFEANPSLLDGVGLVMSFDLFTMHAFATSYDEMAQRLGWPDSRRPKLMFLTVTPEMREESYELDISISGDLSALKGWLHRDGSQLDGVYLQFEPKMLEEAGGAVLRQLSASYTVGVWGYSTDPDDVNSAMNLVQSGVTFVNTDMPHKFMAVAAA